jgi:hypothetical protein
MSDKQQEPLPGLELPPRSPERSSHVALVHVLTPEFQGLDPSDFSDVSRDQVEKASPAALRGYLLDVPNDGRSVVSYKAPESEQWIRMSVTPLEFGLFSRHVDMLAKTAFNGVLASRDEKLRQESGNPAALARTDEDLAAANRASVRQVRSKQEKMETYLETDILPRVELIEKFQEMIKNRNLARGTADTVRERFEYLRTYVFGDMLDAIGNQRQWSARQAEIAKQVIQVRLYLDSDPRRRVENFRGMVGLAEEYYGRKRALVLGRIAESDRYMRRHPEAVSDVEAKDRERSEENG